MARSRMILWPLVALLGAGPAPLLGQEAAPVRSAQSARRAPRATQPQAGPAQAAGDPARMKWLLQKWEGQSAKLKTLDVRIYRVDKDVKWDDEVHFEGRAVFKNPNLAYLDFKKVKLAPDAKGQPVPVKDPKTGKLQTTPTETVLCGQQAVWQYLYDGRQIFIFPLAKEDRQRALDEGPLPFLFNMRAKDAEARYEMTLQGENAKYYLVKVIPRLQDDKDNFKLAMLYLEKTYLLPARILLVSPDGKSTRDFQLHDIRTNEPVKDTLFEGRVYKGWTVQNNPAPDAPRQGKAGDRPGAPARPVRR